MRILLIRNDGIGDLVLTLPAISRIRRLYPNSYIAILVAGYTKDLLWNNPEIDEIIVDNKEGIFTLAKRLYKRFDLAFIFYPNWRNALICFFAKIPLRVGTGYKVCGVLFNKRKFIHRRNCHEADWCIKMVGSHCKIETPKIFIKDGELEYAKGLVPENVPIIGIHPGCKGGALNWTEKGYASLIDKIEEKYGIRSVITGSLSDKPLIERIISKIRVNPINLCGMTNLGQLIALISLYSVFIGPSTGPMHIASCLGIKTIALFPPCKSQSKEKWHPLGKNYKILTPDIVCKKNSCTRCKEYNCMEKISVDEVLENIEPFAT